MPPKAHPHSIPSSLPKPTEMAGHTIHLAQARLRQICKTRSYTLSKVRTTANQSSRGSSKDRRRKAIMVSRGRCIINSRVRRRATMRTIGGNTAPVDMDTSNRMGAEVLQRGFVRGCWVRWLVVAVWSFCSKCEKESKLGVAWMHGRKRTTSKTTNERAQIHSASCESVRWT